MDRRDKGGGGEGGSIGGCERRTRRRAAGRAYVNLRGCWPPAAGLGGNGVLLAADQDKSVVVSSHGSECRTKRREHGCTRTPELGLPSSSSECRRTGSPAKGSTWPSSASKRRAAASSKRRGGAELGDHRVESGTKGDGWLMERQTGRERERAVSPHGSAAHQSSSCHKKSFRFSTVSLHPCNPCD